MITLKKTDELLNYEFNNKIHNEKQINLLANSIKEFWFNSPVVIDKNNLIIAGHWRVQALKKLWIKEVPCVVKDDLTEVQIKKYRLLDNKIAELADDDLENIKFELDEIWDLELSELYDLKLEEDFDEDFALPDWERSEIESVTFQLHKTQNEQLQRAILHSKSLGAFEGTWNDNSNWNALARIIETYNTKNEC